MWVVVFYYVIPQGDVDIIGTFETEEAAEIWRQQWFPQWTKTREMLTPEQAEREKEKRLYHSEGG